MKIELKTAEKIDFSKVNSGDFIVKENGQIRQIVDVDGEYNLIDCTDGIATVVSNDSVPELLKDYDSSFGIERIIQSKNMILKEV